jgi:hypothetical protein
VILFNVPYRKKASQKYRNILTPTKIGQRHLAVPVESYNPKEFFGISLMKNKPMHFLKRRRELKAETVKVKGKRSPVLSMQGAMIDDYEEGTIIHGPSFDFEKTKKQSAQMVRASYYQAMLKIGKKHGVFVEWEYGSSDAKAWFEVDVEKPEIPPPDWVVKEHDEAWADKVAAATREFTELLIVKGVRTSNT